MKYHKDLKEEEGSPSSLPTNYRHTLGVMIPGLQPQGMKRRARNEARNSMSRERSEENGQKCMCPQLKYWKKFFKNTRIVTKERGVCVCVCVLLLLKNKLYFCLFILEGTGACMPQCKYGGQRSPASSSPSPVHGSQGLSSGCQVWQPASAQVLNHLASPALLVFKTQRWLDS